MTVSAPQQPEASSAEEVTPPQKTETSTQLTPSLRKLPEHMTSEEIIKLRQLQTSIQLKKGFRARTLVRKKSARVESFENFDFSRYQRPGVIEKIIAGQRRIRSFLRIRRWKELGMY